MEVKALAQQDKLREIEESFYLKNEEVLNTDAFHLIEEGSLPSVYEVIRVINGIPLFVEEHLQRLKESITLLGSSFSIDKGILTKQLKTLIKVNQQLNKNIKIIISGLSTHKPNVYLFFIGSHYPSELQYHQGVPTILYAAVRNNPNVKAIAAGQREQLNVAISNAKVYEALLVNEKQEITEGSRSNLFFVKSNTLYTPPEQEVLVGITRNRIINLCNKLGISVVEKPIPVSILQEFEGLFLTGTSPKVLPISQVDQLIFDSAKQPLLLTIQKAYDQLIDEYIEKSSRV